VIDESRAYFAKLNDSFRTDDLEGY